MHVFCASRHMYFSQTFICVRYCINHLAAPLYWLFSFHLFLLCEHRCSKPLEQIFLKLLQLFLLLYYLGSRTTHSVKRNRFLILSDVTKFLSPKISAHHSFPAKHWSTCSPWVFTAAVSFFSNQIKCKTVLSIRSSLSASGFEHLMFAGHLNLFSELLYCTLFPLI